MGCGSSKSEGSPQSMDNKPGHAQDNNQCTSKPIGNNGIEAEHGPVAEQPKFVAANEEKHIEREKESMKESKPPPTEKSNNQRDTSQDPGDTESMKLPVCTQQPLPVDFPCLYTKSSSKWPIRNYAPLLDYNVNAGYGGNTALVLCSCSYNVGQNTAQLFLLRSGLSANHQTAVSIVTNHTGHFGCSNSFETDETGRLYAELLFGTNHVAVLSSNPEHGNLGQGSMVSCEDEGPCLLPIMTNDQVGGGCSLVLCSGWEAGVDQANFIAGLYMVRTGSKSTCSPNHLKGDNKWEFTANADTGALQVQGPRRSAYSLYHNSTLLDEAVQCEKSAGGHVAVYDGAAGTDLFSTRSSGSAVVMCSSSSGIEDATCSAVYFLKIGEDNVESMLLKGSLAESFAADNEDLWKFELKNGTVRVIGHNGPCRYGYLSNMKQEKKAQISTQCLATGQSETIFGTASITKDSVVGCLTSRCDVIVKRDTSLIRRFSAEDLAPKDGKFAFQHQWGEEDKTHGFYLVHVYAVGKSVKDGSECLVELDGSPCTVVYQRQGVLYSLSVAGQMYEASTGIVYEPEFSRFVNTSYDNNFGSKCLAFGGVTFPVSVPSLVCGTQDTTLYARGRGTSNEATDEKNTDYKIENISDGKHILRYHSYQVSNSMTIKVNGQDVSSQIKTAFNKAHKFEDSLRGMVADVPVTVTNQQLRIEMRGNVVSAFALMTKDYKDRQKSAAQLSEESLQKQKLGDSADPIVRTLTRKKRQIVGWSQNLIQNASGEAGSLSHWNVTGAWTVIDGGYSTEKAFASSHMDCKKYQEIDLTEHFTAEYLDMAPNIQVSEWYREGVGGGGYYQFCASLMTSDGKVIKQHRSPKTDNLYRKNRWEQESVTFSGYGVGARKVALESFGKDDKFWAGNYGAITSAATVRVQRESKATDDDAYADIFASGNNDTAKAQTQTRDKVVAQVLSDNNALLQELMTDQVVQEVDAKFNQQMTVEQPQRKPHKRKKREIRVFVSSTFRDFKGEREQLIKKTFREINGLCSSRGVFFTYVDLRWGITTEQTMHGQTIAICLQEIERCRPYFICMMGDRFGWSQQTEENPDKQLNSSFDYAIEKHPGLGWLDNHRYGASVTQLEIMHGVLNDVNLLKERSFFYLREKADPNKMPEKEFKVMTSESPWHEEQQYTLRNKVENTAGLNIRHYGQVEEVCQHIKQDLSWCVDEDFPSGTELSALEREKEAHLAFADARRRVYIGRGEYFTQIDDYMRENKPHPLVLLGESGSGKSALVANWSGRLEEKTPGMFMFVHFIGSSAESASYIKLLRRLFEELRGFFRFPQPVPQSDTGLIRDLPMWLKMAGSQAKCMLVFDAVNQLDDGSGHEGNEHDLLWIPKELPPGVSMLISTLPGRCLEAVKAAKWPTMAVRPLDPSEKEQIVTGYLETIYGKTLSQEQKAMIVDAPQTNNPLYLKALLDEVRVFGSFRALTQKIQDYLAAPNPGELFAKILGRLEGDFEKGIEDRLLEHSVPAFEKDRPDLVRQATTAIWCSHRGMAESELIDLLQVPSAVWSPFFLSLTENLVNRNGILNFFHDHLRQAVESRYLPTAESKQAGYKQLAAFFSNRELDDRKVDELPFLLTISHQYDQLKLLLSDLHVFKWMVKDEDTKFELIKAWTLLGDLSSVEAAYSEALNRMNEEEKTAELQQSLGEFYMDIGLLDAAKSMFSSLLIKLESQFYSSHSQVIYHPLNFRHCVKCVHQNVIQLLYKLGLVCEKQKSLDDAQKFYAEAISRLPQVDKPAEKLLLAEGLLGQATVLYLKDNMRESKKYLIRARELATDVLGPRHHYVAAIINKLGQLSYIQARIDEALGYFLQDLSLTRGDVGTSHPRTAAVLNDIALVYDDRNDPLAGSLYEAGLWILLETYGNQHLDVAVMRYNLALFYFATNRFCAAKYQYDQAITVYSEMLGPEHADTKEAQEALKDLQPFLTQ